jgi:O-methyltransferase domain
MDRMRAEHRNVGRVRTGACAYGLAFGKPIFEDLGGKPEDAAIFDAAMNSFHGGETDAVLDAYRYDGTSVLADVGCGSGAMMVATLKRYPAMRGILYDQAYVIERTARNPGRRPRRPLRPAEREPF